MSDEPTTAVAPSYESRMVKFKESWERALPIIRQLLPSHITAERIFSVAVTARQRNPALLECSDISVLRGIIVGAQLGLDVSGVGGKAWLVPFYNKNTGEKEAQFQAGWRGLVELARRTGQIGAIIAREVYEGEDFEYQDGLVQILRHIPTMGTGDPGKIIGAYAVAIWTNGFRQAEVMNRWQIEQVRKSSKATYEGNPWDTHYSEMAKKTVVKRLCKKLPDSVELARVLDFEDHSEIGEAQPIDIPLVEPPAEPPTRTAKVVEQLKRRGRPPKAKAEEPPAEEPPAEDEFPDAD